MLRADPGAGSAWVILDRLAPFRFGLLSVGLYAAPAVAPVVRMAGAGLPSRAYLQVITIPGMTQEPYAREGDQVTAYFDAPAGPSGFFSPDVWSATGRAGSGSQDPCATVYYPAGDGRVARAARCAQAGPGLWMLTTSDGSQAGFARRADGVTITLTGYAADKAALRHAIMAAHRAGDAELWPRTGPIGTAPVNLLFL